MQHHLSVTWLILSGAGGQYVFSALVSSMPPYSGTNYGIKWLYAFLHAVAGNLDKVHVPGSSGDIKAAVKEAVGESAGAQVKDVIDAANQK